MVRLARFKPRSNILYSRTRKVYPLYSYIIQSIKVNSLSIRFKFHKHYLSELNWLLSKNLILGYTIQTRSSLNTATTFVSVRRNSLVSLFQIETLRRLKTQLNDR